MPYKYIGKKTDFIGKTLWEIVGNLKNFGVGRVITRTMYEKYPEPSFFKIVKVETVANPEEVNMDNVRKVKVTVEKTFRGVKQAKLLTIDSASYKADYKLIPKDVELEFCNRQVAARPEKILPRTCEFPPLMRELLKREMIAKGEPITTNPKMEVVYRNMKQGQYKIAQEGEKATMELAVGIGKPSSPNLYKDI